MSRWVGALTFGWLMISGSAKAGDGRPSPRAFEEQWHAKGKSLAFSARWLGDRRLLVVRDANVEASIAEKVAVGLREELQTLGAQSFKVETASSDLFVRCTKGEVVDSNCLRLAVGDFRRRENGDKSIVFVVVNGALDFLPRPMEDGRGEIGPHGGRAQHLDGWAVLSEFYRRRGEADMNARRARGEYAFAKYNPSLAEFGRIHTARHELAHILGLPHHERVDNPGFPEPPGPECKHKLMPSSGPECLLRCGAGQDAWSHRETYGKPFGLCARCLAAARAVVAGIEGRAL